MIHGARGGPARPLHPAAVACSAGPVLGVVLGVVLACVLAVAPAASAAQRVPPSWATSWSWQADDDRLPAGCSPYSGSSSAGVPWSPGLVSLAGGTLHLSAVPPAAGRRATGSGIGCTGKAQRYGRLEVRARIPRGTGLVGRIAFWPSVAGHDSGWSGLTVPSADLSPAYATNGCGDRAYGASLPAHLAGAFHTYVITWTPQGFSVSADGRVLYSDRQSFDGPRWVGISLAATGAAVTRADLLVDSITAYRWLGVPAAAATAGTDGTDDPGPGRRPTSDTVIPGPQLAATVDEASLRDTVRDTPLVTALTTGRPGSPWLLAGSVAAVAVLVGVVRAALSSRRRPLSP